MMVGGCHNCNPFGRGHLLEEEREWAKRFSVAKVEHLRNSLLKGGEGGEDSEADFVILSKSGSGFDLDFVLECLLAAVEVGTLEGLRRGFKVTDKLLKDHEDGSGMGVSRSIWPRLFPPLLLRAVELRTQSVLKELLSLAYDSDEPRLRDPPPKNEPCIMLAAEMDNYQLVRLLLSRGYRLKLKYLTSPTKLGRIARGEATWKDYLELPCLPSAGGGSRRAEEDFFSSVNDIHSLRVLDLMSRPSYILASYLTLAEKKDLDDNNGPSCECNLGMKSKDNNHVPWFVRMKSSIMLEQRIGGCQEEASSPRSPTTGLHGLLQMEFSDVQFHHCPASSKYVPNQDCSQHLECNDPLYRCFDLAKLARKGSKYLPQYRSEFDAIGRRCQEFSAEILSKCDDADQVKTIMEEQYGSMKYFGPQSHSIQSPRLRVAITDNHKDFVSQVQSQHFLTREWYIGTAWQTKMLPYKLCYFAVQTLLTPWHILVAMVIYAGRDMKCLYGKETLPDPSVSDSTARKLLLRYLHFCNDTRINLESPLNKFLSTFGFFLLFLAVVTLAVMKPLTPTSNSGQFHWYHGFILFYSVDVLYSNALLAHQMHSFTRAFDFWKVYSLLMYPCFVISLVLRMVMSYNDKCEEDVEDYVFACPEEYLERRRTLNDFATMFFSFGSILTFMRLTYYLQLHATLGPIVIVSSKVFTDICTMVVIYLVIITAFSFGFIYAYASDVYVAEPQKLGGNQTDGIGDGGGGVASQIAGGGEYNIPTIRPGGSNSNYGGGDDKDHDANFFDTYMDLVASLFWSILEPGKFDSDSATGPAAYGSLAKRYTMATIFASFQLLAVIVLLNLLIAMMNSTVQRVENRKETYWKFCRAGVWVEYFETGLSRRLLPPFTVLNLFWVASNAICRLARRRGWGIFAEGENKEESGIRRATSVCGNASQDSCGLSKRLEHARLMSELCKKVLTDRERSNKSNR